MKEKKFEENMEELASIITIRIGEKPVKLVVDISNNLPNKLYGDAVKISQILLNILLLN